MNLAINNNISEMRLEDITKIIEEAIYYSKKYKEEDRVDYLEGILEIHKSNKINNHEHIYAYLESLGKDEFGQDFAQIKLIKK